MLPLKALRENLSLLLPSNPWSLVAYSCITLISGSLTTWPPSSSWPSSHDTDTCVLCLSSHRNRSVHPNPVWPHLNLTVCVKTYFQIKSNSQVPGTGGD